MNFFPDRRRAARSDRRTTLYSSFACLAAVGFGQAILLRPARAQSSFVSASSAAPAVAPIAVAPIKDAIRPSPALAPAVLVVVRNGDAAVRAGDFKAAARAYEKAADLAPTDPVLPLMAGVALAAQQRLDLATPQFRQAVRLADDDVVGALHLQSALADQGDADEAQSLLQDTYRRFARADGKGGLDASVSIRRLTRRLAKEPDSAILFILLGDAYKINEEWERADSAFLSAVRYAPGWSQPEVNRGLLSFLQGKTDEAIHIFSDAIRRDPNNVQAKFYMGEAQIKDGNSDSAIATLSSVAETRGVTRRVRAEAATGLGQALANAGKYEAAADAYQDAIHLTESAGLFDGTRPALFRALAEAQLYAHRPADAIKTLHQAFTSAPESAAVWHRLSAQAAFDQGDPGRGLTELCASLDADESRYPFDTLNAIAARGLLDTVRTRYQSRQDEAIGGAHTRVAETASALIAVQPPAPAASIEAVTDRVKALCALASIARYENRTQDEIGLRLELTTMRTVGTDWYLLADTYDQRAGEPTNARDAYRQALSIGGLSATQLTYARKRLSTLTAPAYRP